MRLINSDHLEERVRKIIKDYAKAAKDSNITPGRVIFSSCGVIGLVESEPTVDAVHVVRCCDCKNSEHWYRDRRRCFLWDEKGVSVFDDNFCNYGELKGGNDNE